MINKKHLALAFILVAGFIFYFKKEETVKHAFIPSVIPAQQAPLALPAKREVIDQHKKPLARVPSSVSYINTPSNEWEEKLESALQEQAGESLKKITITKERSLIWMRDSNPLHVESVRISMTNKEDVQASFRALVDSQTGKILESFDQTVFDPADARAEFRLNLDQRNAN